MSSRGAKKRTKAAATQQQQQQDEDGANSAAEQEQDDIPLNKKSRLVQASAKQVQELESELKLAREGKHPSELVEKLSQAEQAKQRDLKKATLIRELKMKEVQAHYDFMVQEANNTFAQAKQGLMQQYCGEIEDKIKQLTGSAPSSSSLANQQQQQQQQQTRRGGGAVTTRRPRSKSLESETNNDDGDSQPSSMIDDESQEGGGADDVQQQQEKEKPAPKKSLRLLVTKANANTVMGLDAFVLASKEEIQSDLERIHANWMKRASDLEPSSVVSTEDNIVQVQDGNKLIVGPNVVLEKGNQVIVTRRGLDEEIAATITKISVNEVMIRQQQMDDGSGGLSARIPVSQLKSGRCAIKLQTTST